MQNNTTKNKKTLTQAPQTHWVKLYNLFVTLRAGTRLWEVKMEMHSSTTQNSRSGKDLDWRRGGLVRSCILQWQNSLKMEKTWTMTKGVGFVRCQSETALLIDTKLSLFKSLGYWQKGWGLWEVKMEMHSSTTLSSHNGKDLDNDRRGEVCERSKWRCILQRHKALTMEKTWTEGVAVLWEIILKLYFSMTKKKSRNGKDLENDERGGICEGSKWNCIADWHKTLII